MRSGIVHCLFVGGIFLSATLAHAGRIQSATPDSLIDQGHFKRARTLLQRQLSDNPKDADALVLMARVDLAYEEYEPAIRLLRQAIELQPGNSDAHVYLSEAYGQKIEHAGMFEQMGIAKNIRREAENGVAADPANLDALESLMEFHLQAPGIVGGNKDRARELAERISAIDPVRGNFARAEIAARDKRFNEQKQYHLNALEIAPRSYDALVGAAQLLLSDRWNDYAAAERYAREAIEVEPTRIRGYSLLAQSYAATGRVDALDELLAGAEKHVPDDLSPYFVAARTLVANGKEPERAEKYLRRYLSQEPEGEKPSLATAHWRLGLALEQQGRKDAAIQEMETAVRLNPDLKEAHKDLKRLKS